MNTEFSRIDNTVVYLKPLNALTVISYCFWKRKNMNEEAIVSYFFWSGFSFPEGFIWLMGQSVDDLERCSSDTSAWCCPEYRYHVRCLNIVAATKRVTIWMTSECLGSLFSLHGTASWNSHSGLFLPWLHVSIPVLQSSVSRVMSSSAGLMDLGPRFFSLPSETALCIGVISMTRQRYFSLQDFLNLIFKQSGRHNLKHFCGFI